MSRVWRASVALTIVAAVEVAGILAVVIEELRADIRHHWFELVCLAQPPAWLAATAWVGRRAGWRAQAAGCLAAAATAAALGYMVFLMLVGRGYLPRSWQPRLDITPLGLMAGPIVLTVVALGWAVADRWRLRRTPEHPDDA